MYCKNNSINLKDPTGLISRITYWYDEGGHYGCGTPLQGKVYIDTRTLPNKKHKVVDRITKKVGSNRGSSGCSVVDAGIARGVDSVVSKLTKPIDYLFSTPRIAKVSGAVGKFGILNTVCLGLNVRDNISHYNKWDAASRTVIDTAGFSLTVAFATLTAPIWAPTTAEFIVGTAAEVGVALVVNGITGWVKNKFFWHHK